MGPLFWVTSSGHKVRRGLGKEGREHTAIKACGLSWRLPSPELRTAVPYALHSLALRSGEVGRGDSLLHPKSTLLANLQLAFQAASLLA